MIPNSIRNGIVSLAVLLLPAAALASADVTPPALVSFAFAPSAVDVSATSQTVSVTAEATDDSSGVQSVDCEFRSPSGSHFLSFYMDEYGSALVGGNPLDGIYNEAQTMSTCSEAGTWTLEQISVEDECGNTTYYAATASGSTLAFPAGTQTTLVVTNTNGVVTAPAGPVITGFTFAPMTVSLSPTSTIVTGTATITGSNIQSGYFEFESPSGKQFASGSFYAGTPPPAGTTGTFTGTFTFSSCDAGGTWKIDSISVSSPEGSCDVTTGTNYSATNLPAGTPVSTITVTNPSADTTPPALVSMALSSTSVDVTSGYATLSGSLTATDDSSGVSNAYGTYSGTNGQSLSIDFYNSGLGIILNGTLPGSIDVGNCTVPGVYKLTTLTVEDGCENTVQYKPPFPALLTGTSFLVINGTMPTGSLTVNILPAQAVYNGASWFLDGTNNYNYSGEAVTGLSPGQHTVYFNTAYGYVTSGSETLTIAANQNAFTTGTYVTSGTSDSVQTFLLPPAVTGSALWNVDYGPLQPSGTVIAQLADGTPLTDGTHVIEFSGINGYVPPDTQFLTTAGTQTAITTGTYVMVTGSGSLTVTIEPAGARTAGARWNVDNGPAQTSGATVTGLEAIGHTVNFTGGGTDYAAPASQSVSIAANALTSATGTYTPLSTGAGSLTVTISPGTVGAWYLDADSSVTHKSGVTVTGISGGAHTVNFIMANGYISPAAQDVTILPDETLTASAAYTKAPPFIGAAASFAGISPAGNGLITLTLKDTGVFTGKLVTSNEGTFALTGSLNSMGYFAGTTGHPPIPFVLQVTGTTPSTYVLTGSAGGKEITAYPGVAVAETGTYTALLSGTDVSAAIPQGTGYGTLKFSKTGVGTFKGKLADGTGFTASGIVVAGTAGNQFIVFDPNIYAKKGLFSGVFTFGVPGAGQFDGTLLWVKPAAKGKYYAAGFDTTLDAMGALYVANKMNPVPFTSGTVTFGGAPGISLSQPFTVSGTVVSTGTSTVKIAIKASTGGLSGTFKPVANKPAIKFSGQLLQDPNDASNTIGAGYFLSPVVSGAGYSGGVTLP